MKQSKVKLPKIRAAIAAKLDGIPWAFTSVEDQPIPDDDLVVVKCTQGYAVHVYWYSEVCQQTFREWIPQAWCLSSKINVA